MSQAQPTHQFTLQDSQMLQRQHLLKQLQELQKQNYFNQQSNIFMPHGVSTAVQGFPNGVFSHPQMQDIFLANNYSNQYAHFQGLSSDSAPPFTKGSNNQEEKPPIQSLHGKPFFTATQNTSPDIQSFTDGDLDSKQFRDEKYSFGQFHSESLSAQYQGKTIKIDPSQGETTLDPLEQKILYNMDGDGWNSSFGVKTENYSSKLECSDYLSGSWSALMQSAVGESSSENGEVKEEWSGLSYQNTELSMDNQNSNSNAHIGHRQTDWGDNNATSSLNCKDGNAQQGQPYGESQGNHTIQPLLGNTFPFQGFQVSDGNSWQRNSFTKSHDQTSNPPKSGSSMESSVQKGNDNVTSVAGSFYTRNQHQAQYPLAAAVNSQSPKATSSNVSNKIPPFNLFIPRYASQSNSSLDQVSQRYPLSLETPSIPTNAYAQTPPWVSQDHHEQKIFGENSFNESGTGLKNSQNLSNEKDHREMMSTYQTGLYHGLEPLPKNLLEDIGDENKNSSVSPRDFEAFGRSLNPVKQEMGSISSLGTSIYVKRYPFGDGNMQSVNPSPLSLVQNTADEMGKQGLSYSHTLYGAIRNGQMLSMNDKSANRSTYPSPLGKKLEMKTVTVSLDVTGDRKGTVKISPPSTLPLNLGDTDLSMTRSRKRKTSTSNLLPWHVEITESSKRLQSISVAEMQWAKAVNRLIDTVDFDVKMAKAINPLVRPQKRLVRTTQLMQMVFKPAPAAFLRGKITLNYESLVYFGAKQALGDACDLTSWSRNCSDLPSSSKNMINKESKPSEKASEKLLSTTVEAFTTRAKKLEADLLRMDKKASVLDVVMECKELEKFSMINRFAKFHIRGQPKAAETATSSSSTSSLLTPSPQRYVQALKPRALPEKSQCIAL